MDQIEQAVMYALGPQVDPNLKAQVNQDRFYSNALNTHILKIGKCLL